MNKNEVKKGMLFAVNDLDDGQVYIVDILYGYFAVLCYKGRRGMFSGGSIDVSILETPTKAQLNNCVLELFNGG